MRNYLRRGSASHDSESGDAFGIAGSLVDAESALRSSTLLFVLFFVVGVAVSVLYVLFLQKVIGADPDTFLRAVVLVVLVIAAICAAFVVRIANELDDIRRLQDRYFSIGTRTVFELGGPPKEKIGPDVVDRMLSIDPLLSKEVSMGRARIQYDVDVKVGGSSFQFDAMISGRKRLVLVRSYAEQGRRIDEAEVAKLRDEIQSIIAVIRPRRTHVLAVWRNDLTDQAVEFSTNDEEWKSPAGCRLLRTMIFNSGHGYQVVSVPSESFTKNAREKGPETASVIAYTTAQKGRASRRTARNSIAIAAILILAALAAASILITESNNPNGPGDGGQINLRAHDPIVILGNTGIINSSGVVSGIGTADEPYIIEGWSITTNSTAIEISDTTAYLVIRNIAIVSPGFNQSNGISISNSRNCHIHNVSVDSRGAAGISIGNSAQISIDDSTIKNGSCGIYLRESSEVSILRCSVETNESSYFTSGILNGPGGIGIHDSNTVSIMDTTITNSVDIGVTVRNSNDVAIVNLTCGISQLQISSDISIADSIIRGIICHWDTNVTISGSNLSGPILPLMGIDPYGPSELTDDYVNNGITFYMSRDISILNNIASFSRGNGINIENSTGIDIRGNNASSNGQNGINVTGCDNVTIDWNQLYDNSHYGVRIDVASSTNAISHNTYIGNNGAGSIYDTNHAQAYDDGTNIVWNSGDGHGNYWSDWTTPDANHDGIVDQPYNIAGSAGSMDNYPLTVP